MQAARIREASSRATPPVAGRRVVDAPLRAFHWLFAFCFLAAYATADAERLRAVHVVLGYTMAGLLGFRLMYALVGPRQARLGPLLRRLAGSVRWLRSLPAAAAAGRPDLRRGLALVTGLLTAMLLGIVVPLVASGLATWNDWLGLENAFEEVHEFFGEGMLMLVVAHLAALLLASVIHRRNQALPMVTGRTADPGPDLVRRNNAWLAILLILAVLSYWSWALQQRPQVLAASTLQGGMLLAAAPDGHAAPDLGT